MKSSLKYSIVLYIFVCSDAFAQSVKLASKDAVVWHPEQQVTGELSRVETTRITVHQGDSTFSVYPAGDHFSFQVTLREKKTSIWVEAPDSQNTVFSDTLQLTLGYDPVPIVRPIASVKGDTAIFKAELIDNPYRRPVNYFWAPDSLNPANSRIKNSTASLVKVTIPDKSGHYYFNLFAIAGNDTAKYRTRVTRERRGKLHAFDLDSEKPHWMNKAVVYEITPYSFVENGTFGSIEAKLPELKELGVNTIWLQPVTKSSYRGQGYDVIDYLTVNSDFGTEQELHSLIKAAKALDLRVLFDVVLNHTSIQHPYAQDVIDHGEISHYYDFYQREKDGKPYSSYYTHGEQGFIHYFWNDLVNLNYQNKEVRRWMLEVCKYWVRKYDIDGYRFDAIWGVNARRPSFAKRLRTELKSIKPDVLLLAEDKGSVPDVFELGFDAAYDWTADTSWVSQWAWEYEYDHKRNLTIFNFPDVEERGAMLSRALFDNGGNAHRKLRYIGNNDLPHFIQDYSLQQTKMATALLFSLPGIPMLYNGQEIGKRGHPYSISSVFHRDSTIKSQDKEGLFPFYQKLIQLRQQHLALTSANMREVAVSARKAMVAFHRWKDDEDIFVIINMDKQSGEAYIEAGDIVGESLLPNDMHLQDLLTGKIYVAQKGSVGIKTKVQGHTVLWLFLKR